MVAASGLRRGAEAAALVDQLLADPAAVPGSWWSVTEAPTGAEGEEQVSLRGAVLVRALGTKQPSATDVIAELDAARHEERPRPMRELFRLLRAGGVLRLAMLLAGVVLAAVGVVVEAVLLRTVVDRVAE